MLSIEEQQKVVSIIKPKFDSVLALYDERKYPQGPYSNCKLSFSKLDPSEDDIRNALIWKWGHWGKSNFPNRHKQLILEVQSGWPSFRESRSTSTSRSTFEWWSTYLKRPSTYITTAFITHLVHYQEPIPIIDQHNYRAMGSLTAQASIQVGKWKKRPSKWADIVSLKQFMVAIQSGLPGKSLEDVDRFLMMYGRHYAIR